MYKLRRSHQKTQQICSRILVTRVWVRRQQRVKTQSPDEEKGIQSHDDAVLRWTATLRGRGRALLKESSGERNRSDEAQTGRCQDRATNGRKGAGSEKDDGRRKLVPGGQGICWTGGNLKTMRSGII